MCSGMNQRLGPQINAIDTQVCILQAREMKLRANNLPPDAYINPGNSLFQTHDQWIGNTMLRATEIIKATSYSPVYRLEMRFHISSVVILLHSCLPNTLQNFWLMPTTLSYQCVSHAVPGTNQLTAHICIP